MSNQEIKPDPVEVDNNFLESSDPPGQPSSLVCPECGGAIWETRKGTLRRYQCHIGHTFSMESFLEGQAEEIEYMLWAVLRTLKDRMKITRQMADEAYDNNQPLIAQHFEELAQEAQQRAEVIRQALLVSELKRTSNK